MGIRINEIADRIFRLSTCVAGHRIASRLYLQSVPCCRGRASDEGRLPRGMGVARLCDLPAEWSRQRQMLGLTPAEVR